MNEVASADDTTGPGEETRDRDEGGARDEHGATETGIAGGNADGMRIEIAGNEGGYVRVSAGRTTAAVLAVLGAVAIVAILSHPSLPSLVSGGDGGHDGTEGEHDDVSTGSRPPSASDDAAG